MSILENKVALITGGSKSLGLAMAKALISQGVRVVITARNQDSLAHAVSILGENAYAIPMNVRDPKSVKAAIQEIDERYGRLDIVVNNAAVGCLHRIDRASDDDLQAQVETNLLGVIYVIREAVGLMRRNGGGDIVNVSSESVRLPFPMLSVYAATKGAIECLATGLRDELRPDHIRIATLRCGNIGDNSSFGDAWNPEAKAEAFKIWSESGHLAFVGNPIPQAVVAEALVTMVNVPPTGGLDMVEVRGR